MPAREFQEMLVDRGIGGQFRMKCGSKNAPLLDEHRVPGIFREDFNALADRFDDRRANENHLERFFMKFGRAGVDIAGQLPSVAIAQDRYIDESERILLRPVNFAREQNRSRASPEESAAIRGKFLQRVEQAFFFHDFQVRGAFTAWKNHASNPIGGGKVLRAANEEMLHPKAAE